MRFFAVFKWMLLIVLLLAVTVGGVAGWVWYQRDILVRNKLQERFSEMAPELRLVLGAAQVEGTNRLTLTGVEIRDRQTDLPLFRSKRVEVDVDSEQLLEQQRVVVHGVRLDSADVLLSREDDGRWNWQNYRFEAAQKSGQPLPRVEVSDLRVQLNLKHGEGIPTARLLLTSPRVQALPVSQHAYDLDGVVQLPGAGQLHLAGNWDLKSRRWKLAGNLRDVSADQNLLQLAQAANPGIEQKLQQIDSAVQSTLPPAQSAPGRSSAALLIGTSDVAPRFLGELDVDFNIEGSPDLEVPDFKLRVEVRDGRLSSAAVPVTLTDVNAVLYRDNRQLVFELRNARDGDASLTGTFKTGHDPSIAAASATFDVRNFSVGPQWRSVLPERMQDFYDKFQPRGRVSASGRLTQTDDGRWKLHDVNAGFREGRVLYEKFEYPLDRIEATITQVDAVELLTDKVERPGMAGASDILMDVSATGWAGSQPFSAHGWLRNPGPVAETRFAMSIADVPLDSRFRDALDPKGRSVVDSLDVGGTVSADMQFHRPPGLAQPTHAWIDARLAAGRMRFVKFPYDISNISGRVTFNSESKTWQFVELNGQHNETRIAASGVFRGKPVPGSLDLRVNVTKGRLDADLYNALTDSQRRLWQMIDPDGYCDLTTEIHWTAVKGQPAVVRFPEDAPTRIYNTRIRPKPFPYEMVIESAEVSFDPNDARFGGVQHCEIRSLQANHGNARINATDCWAELQPGGKWQVHLNDLNATNLPPDDDLRAALPDSWRQPMSRLSQTGTISIEDSELDFRGTTAGSLSTTAGWDMNVRLRECSLNAGLEVKRLSGLLTAKGTWDGIHLNNRGDLRFDRAEVLEMPLTQIEGPYTLNEEELILGSRDVFATPNPTNVPRAQRLKALAYGGNAFLDAIVDTRFTNSYRLFVELENALLESYAARHIPDQKNLKGVVSSWLYLKGSGDSPSAATGMGQLQISPAALYELPVMVALFGDLAKLNFNVPNRTAFDYALLTFDVADESFVFNRMDLVGESLALRGTGRVGFGGDVYLDFYSRPPRPRGLTNPLVSLVLTGATQWAKVEVRGTTGRPQTTVRTTAQLDDSMKQFLEAFNPRPGGPIPGLVVPNIFQLPRSPTARRP